MCRLALPPLISKCTDLGFALSHGPQESEGEPEYFSLLTNTKKLLFLTFFDMTAEIGASFQTQGQTEIHTDG